MHARLTTKPTPKPTPIRPTKEQEKSKWYDVGPEDAKVFLSFNTEHNRPVNRRHVEFLTSEMQNGRFLVTGDTIKIDRDGRLIDGQHRLHAIIKSGITLRMLIVDNLDPVAFTVIDQGGRVRGVSDVLAINREVNVRALNVALTAVWKYKNGYYPNCDTRVSSKQLLDVLEKHPELRDIARRTTASGGAKFLRGAPGALLLFYGRKYPDLLEQFWNSLQEGTGLEPSSGCYHLRERIIKQRTQTAKLHTVANIALTIKAWNVDVQEKVMRSLSWRSDEPFPRFI